MNVLLRFFDTIGLQNTTIRAAADDLGGVIRTIAALISLAKAFDRVWVCSGLGINPLGRRFCIALVELVRLRLVRFVPAWCELTIRGWGKYLGFTLGPHGGARMWLKAEAKWKARASVLASSQRATSLIMTM
jgi:hypothetical protein